MADAGVGTPSDAASSPADAGAASPHGKGLKRFIRSMIQNSPGMVIAIAIHAAIGAIFLVWKMGTSGGPAEDTSITATKIGAKSITDEQPPEPEIPELPPDRSAIPDNVAAELVPTELAELIPTEEVERDLTQDIGDPNSVSEMPDSDPTGGTSIGVGEGGGHRGTGTPSPFASRKLGSGLKKGVRPSGATQGTEEAIRLGLLWLARHQNENGSWSALTCKDHCPGDHPCQPETGADEGGYTDRVDVGLTGLSLLCYLGAGFGHNARQHVVDTYRAKKIELGKDVILPGLKWLVSQQQQDGSFTDPSLRFLYNDAIATLALCEAYGLSQNKQWKEPAQRAINFLCAAQKDNPNGKGKWGWRYVGKGDVEAGRSTPEKYQSEKAYTDDLYDADTSVAGWCVMALKSAMLSGLDVPQESVDGALTYVKWNSATNGLVGYMSPDAAGVEIAGEHDVDFKYHIPAMAAVGMCIRVFIEANIEDPYLKLSADQIVKALPSATEAADTKNKGKSLVDYYYWYYGALALNQLDGPDAPKRSNKYWGPWNKAMQDSILELQSREEKRCSTGGFMKPDRWSYGIGPIYTTAINILTLEVYYRYENAFGAAQSKKSKKPAKAKDDVLANPDATAPEQKNP
ncbi:MAG: hypothetical protein EXS13_07255 [Planctomycetes bacterium]|nr:hypothetical protein [Planctomycetota bacterium]